jgi:uncharacterized protein YabN with tetrapyrrole methylase and pyrophosphatase domain
VGKKASFFDFETADAVFDKLYEEIEEVREAMKRGDQAEIDEEMGDLLLTVTSLARKTKTDSELALTNATNKFIDRFETVEKCVTDQGKRVEELTMSELDAIWDDIKHKKD